LAQDQEKMKAMIAFKKRLEEQLEKLGAEVKEVQATLDTVNIILLEKGFKRGDMKEVAQPAPITMQKEVVLPKPATEEPPAISTVPMEPEVIPLKTMADETLAIMHFDKQTVHVMPQENRHFSINTPPFTNFLIEKVFAKMQEKDKELVRLGQLSPDKMFSYSINHQGDTIREITIKNVDEDRLKELKSSIRWTFEKMFEKMKG
jgi:hypothetical protein